jgi:predicted Rossmann-fold nucleotide-binding protein
VADKTYVAVVGPGDASEDELANAEAVGRRLTQRGATLVTGGLGGVMAAASKGA